VQDQDGLPAKLAADPSAADPDEGSDDGYELFDEMSFNVISFIQLIDSMVAAGWFAL
jgi:hypothetical protein